MKLKSKLIATIVSICAAIAVMGVGVWAATDTFSVTVTNNVNLSFQNLAGTVTVTANAAANSYASGKDALALSEKTLYERGTVKYNAISTAATTEYDNAVEGSGNLQFEGAGFLSNTYLDRNTTGATLMYEFVYTPESAALDEGDRTEVGSTSISVTSSEPVVKGAKVEYLYFVRINSQTSWTKLTPGTALTTGDASDIVYVRAIAQYTNASGLTVTTEGAPNANWEFDLEFKSVAQVSSTITGAITMEDTIQANGLLNITGLAA